jgi:hypothetical protein
MTKKRKTSVTKDSSSLSSKHPKNDEPCPPPKKKPPKPKPPPPPPRSTRSKPLPPARSVCNELYTVHVGPNPTCLNFGQDRKETYPSYFFCAKCSDYEALPPDQRKIAMRQPRGHYPCQAKHTNYSFPTERVTIEYKYGKMAPSAPITYSARIAVKYKDVSDSEGDEDDCEEEPPKAPEVMVAKPAVIIPPTPMKEQSTKECSTQTDDTRDHATTQLLGEKQEAIDALQRELIVGSSSHQTAIMTQEEKYVQLQTNLQEAKQVQREKQLTIDALQKEVTSYKMKLDNKSREAARLRETTTLTGTAVQKAATHLRAISSLCTSHRLAKTVSTEVVKILTDETFMYGIPKDKLFRWGCMILRTEVYNEENLAKMCDFELVPLSVIELMRKLQTKGEKYYRGSAIACEKGVRRVMGAMEAYGDDHLPAEYGLHDGKYDYVRFNPKDVVEKTLAAHGVPPSPDHQVNISQSMDGTRITKNLNCTVTGFKVNDKSAICPATKKPLFANTSKDTIQSRKNCFPLHVAMMPEKKETYVEYCKSDITNLTAECKRLNTRCATDTDMSCTWKVLCKGGGLKNATFGCHCCSCHKNDLNKANARLCDRCIQIHGGNIPDGLMCYHHEFLDEKKVQELNVHLSLMDDKLSPLMENIVEDVDGGLVFEHEINYLDPRVVVTREMKAELKSIHWEIQGKSLAMRDRYFRYLKQGLELRGLDFISGSLAQKQNRLREAMEFEFEYMDVRKKIEHGEKGSDKALFLVLDCVPCILHLENRVGLKILTQLLKMGLASAMTATDVDTDVEASEQRALAKFLDTIEHIVNKEILGSTSSAAHVSIQTNPKKTKIGTITMDGERTRTIIDNFDLLIDAAITVSEEKRTEWKTCIASYREAMLMLRQKADFTDQDIWSYQKVADKFYASWMNLTGTEGLTNYIHMMGAGHLMDYLLYWRNLYVHSQQGWEAFNNLLKIFYLRRTQRGGATNQGKGPKDRIKPIGRWLQRRYLWTWGVTFKDAVDYLKLKALNEELNQDEDALMANLDATGAGEDVLDSL